MLEIYLGVGMFTAIVVLLVLVIIAAKSKLVASGDILIGINGDASKSVKTSAGNKLLGALAEFPRVVSSAAEFREPHRIARYLEELAGTYHGFYNDCRVLPMGDEQLTALHTARLLLCTATKQVISNGLDLLGVSAPERM